MLIVQPFAEEANRSRRMLHVTARSLAAAGIPTLILDLYGTGDSAGTFAEASWSGWCADVGAGLCWLQEQGHDAVSLLGLRLGASLALEVACGNPVEKVVLWNPVIEGNLYLKQVMRIRLAAMLFGGAESRGKETARDIEASFAAGNVVEIGGYEISAALAEGLASVDLSRLGLAAGMPIAWFHVGSDVLPPAALRVVDGWREAGLTVSTEVVAGEPFWAIEETTLVPDLAAATVALWEPQA